MSVFGFTDSFWMARNLIANAHPTLVKRAVITVINHLEQVDTPGGTSPLRILEMLVQVASTGEYVQQSHEVQSPGTTSVAILDLDTGTLNSTDEAAIQAFRDLLEGLPTSDEPENESYEDFLKRLGIPNLDDFRESDEDE